MSNLIHPTAVVHPKAELASDVEVGAFAYVGEHVKIGKGSKVLHHGCVEGHTTIGENCEIGSFSVIGGKPQDLKYKGEPTRLEIGDRNLFREYVTVNTGTVSGAGVTKIGNDCLLMAYVHVAHDCVVHNNVIMANSVGLCGHVTLEDWVIVSGMVGISQFCRIGKHAFIAGQAGIDKDVAPYVVGMGDRLQVRGINIVGLKRRGFTLERIRCVQDAYSIFFESGKEKNEALAELESKYADQSDVRYLIDFIKSSEQGISR